MKKVICLVLTLLMLLPFVVACADNNGDSADTTTAGNADNVTTPDPSAAGTAAPSGGTTLEQITPDLPDVKYSGYKFIVANDFADATKYTSNLITADSQIGEPINDAIYNRTMLVEEMFGIDIVDEDVDVTPYMNVIQSGEDTYAIVTADLSHVMTVVNAGHTLDFNDVDTIDLTNPWWDQNAAAKLHINGSLYYHFSDFFITALDNARATYFNKDLITALSLEDPYQLVKDNKWTIEKMREMAVAAVSELDGDGTITTADRVGIANNATTFYEAMLTGCDAEIVKMGDDDLPYFCCYDEREFFINVYQTLLSTFSSDDLYLIAKTEDARTMFINGNALFTVDTLYMASRSRQADINFGILPIAKWDEAQENYLHVSPNPHAMMIPSVTSNVDRTGVLLEALSYYSSAYYSEDALIPAYFENSLRYKSTTDVESADMLTIIHDNISYVNKIAGTSLSGAIYNYFEAGVMDITSALKKLEGAQKKTLNNVLEDLAK
ncbi:MAG: hypothetical protein IJY27_01325 [Clostridia bacterium]|nr:hypothetical protein [Clostridia bacterium]